MPKSAAAPDADQATTTTVAAAVSSRAPTQPAHRTRASLPELADVRSRRAMKQSQRQQRRAAATSRLSANYGCSVFLLRVRASYPSSPTLPHHRNSTSPCLLARSVHRSSTVSRLDASDPLWVCTLVHTHRISRATRTANVMGVESFLRVAGGGELRCPLSYVNAAFFLVRE